MLDSDVFWPRDPLLCRQLVYVAVSRASQAVSLVAGQGHRGDGALWSSWLDERGPRA